jgi:hypothetical protein
MIEMAAPLHAKGSVVEPIIDSLLDKVTDIPQLTIRTLMEEIFNLLSQPVIQQHEEAKSLLKDKLTHILAKNPEELLESKEKKIYNCISSGLTDRQGRVNKCCLDILKEIDLEKPVSTKKQSLQIELQEMRKQLTLSNRKQENYLIELNTLKKLTLFTNTFGKDEWNFYFGNVGAVPPLPNNIEDILTRRCMVTGKGLVRDTHLLVLIPATVNGQPFTFNRMLDLSKAPLRSAAVGLDMWQEASELWGSIPNTHSRWVLMSKNLLPQSINQCHQKYPEIVASLNQDSALNYEIPGLLEATTCLLTYYFSSSTHLLPGSYTSCCEQQVPGDYGGRVVDFKPGAGFYSMPRFTVTRILYLNWSGSHVGVAPLIRL